jgi:oligopeptide/dipeptide ABC transporter ATP-binding protein
LNSVFAIDMDFDEPIPALKGEAPSPLDPPVGCSFGARCPEVMPVCLEEKPKLRRLGPDHEVACHLFAGADDSG